MVNSINSTDSDGLQLMMAQMYQKVNAANTDGIAGLSKSELSSIDMGNDKGGAAFLKSLSDQFDSLDADGNGQLTAKEVSSAKLPTGPFGPPPGMKIESSDSDSGSLTGSVSSTGKSSSTDSTSSTSSSSSMESLLENLLEKLLQQMAQRFNHSGGSTADGSGSNSDKVSELVSSSDTDKNGSLSAAELKSIDTSGNNGKVGFVNDLIKNFSKYDTDNDGSLSQSEVLASMPKDPSQQTTASISSSDSSFNNIKAFMNKLISAYEKSGGVANVASALSIAG